jgi:RNA polymerase sigma factor (sigma-70 family)
MADSPQNAARATRFKRVASRFIQNTLPQGDSPDDLMEQYRQDPANTKLAEACLYAVLAKATQAAIKFTRNQSYMAGLTVELANDDLVHDLAMDVAIGNDNYPGIMNDLKNGLYRNGGYVMEAVKLQLKNKREKAANRARIEQEKWLPEQATQTNTSEFDSSDYDALRDQIANLPGQVRSAVTLHFLDGLPIAEVADQLGVSVRTAYRMKDQGVELLRAALVG